MVKTYVANVEELNNPALFEKLYVSVSEHRRRKIDRIRTQKDKRLSLGAWVLLQKGLADRGICSEELTLSYGENGKPFLKDYPDIFFNLSHSGERVMCAVADCEVGCDVERIRDTDFKVAKRFFHREEYEMILSQPEKEKQQALFYRLWTLKESFLKMTGMGMALSLDSFAIHIMDGCIMVKQQGKTNNDYFFREYDLQDGYCYACCAAKSGFEAELMKTLLALADK